MSVSYRQGGHEKEYRWRCSRCTLFIGYQSTPPPVKNAPFVYILKGALTEAQGQIPADAFEGDETPQQSSMVVD